jgi:hypothetical protein
MISYDYKSENGGLCHEFDRAAVLHKFNIRVMD